MPGTIALAALTVLDLAPPDMVTCAAAAGYSHVGLRLLSATPDEPTYPTVGDTPLVHEVERRLARSCARCRDLPVEA